jgi:predicted DCC family thiol-disulfide oxidoreductase YuxK
MKTLVFDGDCGFCTTCVRFIERRMGTEAHIIPWQLADLGRLGTTRKRAEYELLWFEDGRTYGGAQAMAKLLIDAGLPWSPLGWIMRVPPFRWLAHGVYRLVAANRRHLPGGTPACGVNPQHRHGRPPESPPVPRTRGPEAAEAATA